MNAYHTSLVLVTKYVLKEHFEEEVNIGAGFQAYAVTKRKTFFTIKLHVYRKMVKNDSFQVVQDFQLAPMNI